MISIDRTIHNPTCHRWPIAYDARMADKDPAAVALGKRRAATLTTEHQSKAGKAAASVLTKQQRSARARKAAIARHSRKSGG